MGLGLGSGLGSVSGCRVRVTHLVVDEAVLELDVPVDDALLVQVPG